MINDLKNLTLEPKLLQEIVWSLTPTNDDLQTENEFLREQLRLFRARDPFGNSLLVAKCKEPTERKTRVY